MYLQCRYILYHTIFTVQHTKMCMHLIVSAQHRSRTIDVTMHRPCTLLICKQNLTQHRCMFYPARKQAIRHNRKYRSGSSVVGSAHMQFPVYVVFRLRFFLLYVILLSYLVYNIYVVLRLVRHTQGTSNWLSLVLLSTMFFCVVFSRFICEV